MCSTIKIRAQQIYNCNDVLFESNQELKNTLSAVLNSTDLVYVFKLNWTFAKRVFS